MRGRKLVMTLNAKMAPQRKAAGHGTYSGYQKHLRTGTRPCLNCTEAKRLYVRNWRSRTEQQRQLPEEQSGRGPESG